MTHHPQALQLTATHRRRLRTLWRSAGWPAQDLIDAELLAAGLLERHRDDQGRETLRLTTAGLETLVDTAAKHRQARSVHEALVDRVASEMQRAGRVVFTGLSLRAPLVQEGGSTAWAVAMPDVFSIRVTTVEDYVEPVVHEVKVHRSDLLAELRQPQKTQAYAALASQTWLVLAEGIGHAEEVPEAYGVMLARRGPGQLPNQAATFGALEVLRPAPRLARRVPFAVWMALARAQARPTAEGDEQLLLGDPQETLPAPLLLPAAAQSPVAPDLPFLASTPPTDSPP
jgi:hypothetical protein